MRWVNGALSERDVWITAGLMIRRYGSKATLEAAARADELSSRGDEAGCCIWDRIITAIEEISHPDSEYSIN